MEGVGKSVSSGAVSWSRYPLWFFGGRTELSVPQHLHKLSTCTYIRRGKCVYINRQLFSGQASSMWADISDAEMCTCRGEAVCFLKKTAPNTVILPLLLTPVCRTVILVKIFRGSSLCGEQLLLLSLLRPVPSAWSGAKIARAQKHLLLIGRPGSRR